MRIGFLSRLSLGTRCALAILILAIVAGAATIGHWLPRAEKLVATLSSTPAKTATPCTEHGDHEDEVHGTHADASKAEEPSDHDDEHEAHAGEEPDAHAGEKPDAHAKEADLHKPTNGHQHDEAATVSLSASAQENVGVQVATIELKPFERTITVPAMVVERQGRSHVQIAAPLTGVVTRIYPTQGEAVAPGEPLFDLRLTHEEVVEAQGAFLQTAEELDVIQREIVRLEQVTADGAIAGKTLLERKYEEQKLEAMLRSQRQRLLLHGLSSSQVDDILTKRTLLGEMTVFVPGKEDAAMRLKRGTGSELADANAAENSSREVPVPLFQQHAAPLLQVEEMKVDKGQHIRAGELLCVLADYSELYIQGKAFEQDIAALDHAANEDWRVAAVVPSNDPQRQIVPNLKILSLSNTVDPESRAFGFFVDLPNKLIRDRRTPDGHRFCAWQFKPGQRLELLVPVERWSDRIVLPRDAVVEDGAESYVFEKIGGHFDRRPVRVEYRDQYSAVLANAGDITPGKTVVIAGAYQIHLAMKNKSGSAPDPHAGHNH